MILRLGLGLVAIPLLIVLGLVLYYGEIEPCRMLAKDMANEAKENDVVDVLNVDTEPYFRAMTSQYSHTKCTRELADAWWTRLTGEAAS